jgi:hypothetical protein
MSRSSDAATTVAQRTFQCGGEAVVLTLSAPTLDGQDYRCAYRIAWPDGPVDSYAFGVDGVQAIYVALQKAHIELIQDAAARGKPLTWLDQGDLMLPLPPGMSIEDVLQPPSVSSA